MFDIGFWEIMVISILAMVVIGPERLPGVAKTVGHWFGKTRRFIEGVKEDVSNEFDTTELKRLLHNQEVQLKELQSKVDNEAGDIRNGFSYNLDDQGQKLEELDQESEDDYLEFMDEDEEKDHVQIAAEKEKVKQEADKQTRSFEDPAVENNQPTNDDDIVISEVDQTPKNDG